MTRKCRRVSTLGIGVVALLAVAPFGGVAWGGAPMHGPPMDELEGAKRLQELFMDISTINLLNGLRLTRQQTEALLALAREADRLRTNSPHAQYYRKAVGEAIRAYEAFKAEALKGEPPGEKLSRWAVHHEFRVQGIRNRRARLTDHHMAGFDAKLRAVLTEGQLQIIETFKPCLVPPKDLKDPVSAGQVDSGKGAKMLQRLRALAAPIWASHRDEIAERHVRLVEGPHIEITSPEARAAQKARFIAIVEKARAMSDVEFEMEKGKLGEQLGPQESRRALFQRAQVARPRARPHEVSRVARWLLHPRIIPILEARLRLGTPFQSAPGASQAGS